MVNALHIPLSWLYAAGVAIRHVLYDRHLLPSFTVSVPTICVGNLAVGGTGKTPMTAYIVRLLLDRGYHPAILSRGYKRSSRGFVMADQNASVETIGDEAMQLHRAFPEVPIAVCENRVRGVKQLKRQVEKLDVLVLDDAMQHRALRPGFTVLLTAYDRLYTGIQYPPMEEKGTPLVLCGIAQPHYLFDHVRAQYPNAQLLAFPDHHNYSPADVETILDRASRCDWVLTTEKDLPRLQATDLLERLEQQHIRLVALPIAIRFYTPQEAFDRQILRYVHESLRQ